MSRLYFSGSTSHNRYLRNLQSFAFLGSSFVPRRQQIDPAVRELAKEWAFAVNPSQDHGAGDLDNTSAAACHSPFAPVMSFLTLYDFRRDHRRQPLFRFNTDGSLNPGTGTSAHGRAPGCLRKGGCLAGTGAEAPAQPNKAATSGQQGRWTARRKNKERRCAPPLTRHQASTPAPGACVTIKRGRGVYPSLLRYRQDIMGTQAPT